MQAKAGYYFSNEFCSGDPRFVHVAGLGSGCILDENAVTLIVWKRMGATNALRGTDLALGTSQHLLGRVLAK